MTPPAHLVQQDASRQELSVIVQQFDSMMMVHRAPANNVTIHAFNAKEFHPIAQHVFPVSIALKAETHAFVTTNFSITQFLFVLLANIVVPPAQTLPIAHHAMRCYFEKL